ncbi:hypothetical protein [Lapillicoccus jejuensis]|uniref:Uncharacterized protein n=1 Tax=Lapillicoccus jejuensis TaxID=402171 RepID=A0A542DXW3_9MICO|nr:hypothetical protein [Lapillicoccus jejuensis]TQJ07915.1 hypothetical protein FB458_0986 [Lapillicoccus jejuensis]
MTTTGGPQDAVPQDAVPDEQAEEHPERSPAPPSGPALWRLLAVHVALVLLLVLAATAVGEDSCDGRGAWCFSPGAMAWIALLLGGAALLSMLGATITVLTFARRVRGTAVRVLLGLVGGVVTLVVVGSPLTRPYLGL